MDPASHHSRLQPLARCVRAAAAWSASAWVQALLVLYIGINACGVVLTFDRWRHHSVLIDAVSLGRHGCAGSPQFGFVLENGAWRAFREDEDYQELWAKADQNPPQAAIVWLNPRSTVTEGIWTPIWETTGVPGYTSWFAPPPSPADYPILQSLLADRLRELGAITTPAEHQAVATGVPLIHHRVHWLAVLNDASVLSTCGLILLGRAHRAFARRTRHRLSQGLCPRCTYALTGLSRSQCPECGEPIPLLAPVLTPSQTSTATGPS